MRDSVGVLSDEVCAWGTGLEARGGIDGFLDLGLGIHRGGTRSVIWGVMVPPIAQIRFRSKFGDRKVPTFSGTIKLTVTGDNPSFVAEKPTSPC